MKALQLIVRGVPGEISISKTSTNDIKEQVWIPEHIVEDEDGKVLFRGDREGYEKFEYNWKKTIHSNYIM